MMDVTASPEIAPINAFSRKVCVLHTCSFVRKEGDEGGAGQQAERRKVTYRLIVVCG